MDVQLLRMLAACLLMAMTVAAGAHTRMVGSEPANGAVLESPPERIVLRFSTPVTVVEAVLTSADGKGAERAVGAAAAGAVVTFTPALDPGAAGLYTLRWRVAGADSHAVRGVLTFRVGSGAPPAPVPAAAAAAAENEDEAVSISPSPEHARVVAAVLSRTVLLLALLAAAGALFFRRWIDDVPAVAVRRVALVGLAALASLCALMRSELGPAAPAVGPILVAAGLAAIAIGRGVFASTGAVIAIAGLAFWGHALLDPRALGEPLYALHVAAAALWAGSLWPLHALVRREPNCAPAVMRYSRVSLWVVGVLAALGLALAALRLGSVDAIATTAYGRVLAAKVGLFVILFGIAGWNRLRLSSRLPQSAPALARTIDVELSIMVVVVIAAAWLSALPPPAS